MARAGRKRKATVTLPTVHDRRSTDLVRNASVAIVEVDDPYAIEPGGKITVLRSLRDDPLARMSAAKQIDSAQFEAGRAWQADYEEAEVGGASAIDPTKEAVDGGKPPEMFTDRKRRAAANLARAARELGAFQESIVRDVLARRMFPNEVAIARGFSSQREVDHYSWLFRRSLEILAVVYKFAMPVGHPTKC